MPLFYKFTVSSLKICNILTLDVDDLDAMLKDFPHQFKEMFRDGRRKYNQCREYQYRAVVQLGKVARAQQKKFEKTIKKDLTPTRYQKQGSDNRLAKKMKIRGTHKQAGAADFSKAINLAEIDEFASFISDDIAYKGEE